MHKKCISDEWGKGITIYSWMSDRIWTHLKKSALPQAPSSQLWCERANLVRAAQWPAESNRPLAGEYESILASLSLLLIVLVLTVTCRSSCSMLRTSEEVFNSTLDNFVLLCSNSFVILSFTSGSVPKNIVKFIKINKISQNVKYITYEKFTESQKSNESCLIYSNSSFFFSNYIILIQMVSTN